MMCLETMADLEKRLQSLVEKLGAQPPIPSSNETAANNADLQATATAQVDALLVRIAALTSALNERGNALDAVDRVTARLLLNDLAMLAGWWRGLGDLASARLESAAGELEEAARAADRALKDPRPEA